MTKKAGFTMVEILIAMGVFVVGIFAIMSVFPRAKDSVIASEDKSLSAQYVNSLAKSITQGAHDFAAKNGSDSAGANIPRKDVAFFNIDLNKSGGHQDFFVIPKDTNDNNVPSEVVWYPTKLAGGSWPLSRSAVDIGTTALVGSGQIDGLDGFTGQVRRIGRTALGSSNIDEDITETNIEFPERLQNFFFCFSITTALTDKKTLPLKYSFNLYKVTIFLYHKGADESTITAGQEQSGSEIYTLLDSTNPVSKANRFVEKFEFYVNINKAG